MMLLGGKITESIQAGAESEVSFLNPGVSGLVDHIVYTLMSSGSRLGQEI